MTSFIGCLSDIVLFCYGQAAHHLRMPFAKLLAECGELFFFELLQMLQFFHDANHISVLLSAEGKVVVVNDGTGDDGNDSNGKKERHTLSTLQAPWARRSQTARG